MSIAKTRIGRDTKITFTITGVEAAKIYGIIGKSSGTGSPLWNKLCRLFEEHNDSARAYQKVIRPLSPHEALRYSGHERQWLEELFGKERYEDRVDVEDIQSQIDVLQEKLESAKLVPVTATQIIL